MTNGQFTAVVIAALIATTVVVGCTPYMPTALAIVLTTVVYTAVWLEFKQAIS